MRPATAVSLDENLPDLKKLEALGRLVADLVAGERRVRLEVV